ncbi:MAG: carbon storage regulator [Dehalococcoidia bacterium]|nr:MAG: carbon storage regulator [Dehalococcoidia bacterium]
MLVLTRKAGESIVIGGDVELTVLEIDGDHIRLGIQAPRSVPVYRAELWAEIQRGERACR